MIVFLVEGKEHEVRMMNDGIDISADFIGNTHHGMGQDDEGRYLATQEDLEWWITAIEENQQMEVLIAEYKECNDPDEVDRVVQEWITNDFHTDLVQVKMGLEQNFGQV